jgi:hypothetical protein
MTEVVSFESAAGTVKVEIAGGDGGSGLGPAGFGKKPAVAALAAPLTFEQAMASLGPTVQAIAEQFSGLPNRPHEIEVCFGLKITGAFTGGIVSAAGESQFTVTLRWADLPTAAQTTA